MDVGAAKKFWSPDKKNFRVTLKVVVIIHVVLFKQWFGTYNNDHHAC